MKVRSLVLTQSLLTFIVNFMQELARQTNFNAHNMLLAYSALPC